MRRGENGYKYIGHQAFSTSSSARVVTTSITSSLQILMVLMLKEGSSRREYNWWADWMTCVCGLFLRSPNSPQKLEKEREKQKTEKHNH